ncbi:unannotated protein [freshwater metagenome]|uniref:Unannotated protein n=1 Tax=freshwater metagenome TaxID=449393 RepID=A0A6J7EJP7_9ZZZZ|nr:DUF4395 family protein [Actinomycetota bacterium]
MRSLFRFPNPVNEVSARLVAGGVVLQCIALLVVRQWWLLVPLTYGFVARVATGPTLSPLGQLVTRVITPRLGGTQRLVPGPPKRFAQGIGATCTVGASIAWACGAPGVAMLLVAAITAAATLESVFGYCLGCVIFGRLMRWGIISPSVCEACNDLTSRWAAVQPARVSSGV